jgi:hypothetical protein
MSIDLRDRLEMTRHVRGCALFTTGGQRLGALGAEGDAVEAAGRSLLACLEAIGTRGEPSLAAIVAVDGGELFLRSFRGELLVVKTDGDFFMSEGCFEALVEALTPRESGAVFESTVRESAVVARDQAADAWPRTG